MKMIVKNKDAASKEFWKFTGEARNKVETTWPEWKKNVRVTMYSVGFSAKVSRRDNGSKK